MVLIALWSYALPLRPACRVPPIGFPALLAVLLLLAVPASAQSGAAPTPQAQSAATSSSEESAALAEQLGALSTEDGTPANNGSVERVLPLTMGINASLVTTSQHDSNSGWSSLLTPNIAYRFDRHFSLNLGLPVYTYIDVDVTTDITTLRGVVTGTETNLVTQNLLLGDTTLNAGYDAHTKWLDDHLTGTLSMPTGDDAAGLGAGQFTFAFINHMGHCFYRYLFPNIELGIDDSPNLIDTHVLKNYTVVGTNAHFQAGLGFVFPQSIYFETDAYEELPLAAQTVTYTTVNGRRGRHNSTTTSSQESLGEDNGFMNTLQVPLSRHIILSGFYNRSLRNATDTAGFSFTFLLRAPQRTTKHIVH